MFSETYMEIWARRIQSFWKTGRKVNTLNKTEPSLTNKQTVCLALKKSKLI